MAKANRLEATLQKDIDVICSKVQQMADLVEVALANAMKALLRNKGELAYSVMLRDQEIDECEKEIDRLCLEFLIRQQPAAGPLRFVYATIKINQELERIGDYAESIARQGLVINSLDVDIDYKDYKAISKIAISMLRNSIAAFLGQEADSARFTMLSEKDASRVRTRITDALFELRGKKEIPMEAFSPLRTVAIRLDRAADQAKNICEETLYMCTGQYMKHIGKEVFRVLFVDDDNTKASQLAEAIGNSLREPNFVFMSAGIRSKKINAKAAGFLESKGHDIGNNISKSVENIPNLDHYQVIISLSEKGKKAFPTPPTKTISIEWDLAKVSGSLDETYDYLKRHIKDLVRAIHGQAKK